MIGGETEAAIGCKRALFAWQIGSFVGEYMLKSLIYTAFLIRLWLSPLASGCCGDTISCERFKYSLAGELRSTLIFDLEGSLGGAAINGVDFCRYGLCVFSLCFTYYSKSSMLSSDSSSSFDWGTYTRRLDSARFEFLGRPVTFMELLAFRGRAMLPCFLQSFKVVLVRCFLD